MTEPREHESVEEAEFGRPEPTDAPTPDTGAWRPVSADPVPDMSAEPVVEESTEPVQTEHERGEAEPEPLVEPAAATEPMSHVEASDDEPTAVVEEPSPAPAVEQPAEPAVEPVENAEPESTGDEPTAVVREEPSEEPTTVVAEEPTAVVAGEPTTVVAEEPTAVVAEPEVTDSATQRLPLEGAPTPPPVVPADGIFRPASPTSGPGPEPTRMEQLSEEEQKLAAERAARRDARAAALAAPAPAPLVTPAPVIVHKRTNDKFWGALGLFLLRIVLAGIFAIRGLNILTDIPTAQAQFAKTVIPQPEIMAIVTGVAAELIALALLLGLLTRVAGLGIALIAGGALAFVYWSPNWSPFVPGQAGFLGEYELLLAVVGVLLLLIGGGGWSLDRSFRAGRERDKQERVDASA